MTVKRWANSMGPKASDTELIVGSSPNAKIEESRFGLRKLRSKSQLDLRQVCGWHDALDACALLQDDFLSPQYIVEFGSGTLQQPMDYLVQSDQSTRPNHARLWEWRLLSRPMIIPSRVSLVFAGRLLPSSCLALLHENQCLH
jgi:hypothetical protein